MNTVNVLFKRTLINKGIPDYDTSTYILAVVDSKKDYGHFVNIRSVKHEPIEINGLPVSDKSPEEIDLMLSLYLQ